MRNRLRLRLVSAGHTVRVVSESSAVTATSQCRSYNQGCVRVICCLHLYWRSHVCKEQSFKIFLGTYICLEIIRFKAVHVWRKRRKRKPMPAGHTSSGHARKRKLSINDDTKNNTPKQNQIAEPTSAAHIMIRRGVTWSHSMHHMYKLNGRMFHTSWQVTATQFGLDELHRTLRP